MWPVFFFPLWARPGLLSRDFLPSVSVLGGELNSRQVTVCSAFNFPVGVHEFDAEVEFG
jgi:hypothetical protein